MTKTNNKVITSNGKAAFYASIYEDLRKAAMDCGWALGLYGSLANDGYLLMLISDDRKGGITCI